jgi:hypothetical protein
VSAVDAENTPAALCRPFTRRILIIATICSLPSSTPLMSPLFGSIQRAGLLLLAFPGTPPFRPCTLSSPLPRILLGPTPRRRTRLLNTANSRANTGTHNFQTYFALSHPHRRHSASQIKPLHKHDPTPQTYKSQRIFEWVPQNPPLLFFLTTTTSLS